MLPIILFVAVLGVGALGLCALFVVLRERIAEGRAVRARAAAYEARIAASRAKKVAAAAAAAASTIPERAVSLTGLFATLEESAGFARIGPPVAPPRHRMAKGSVPIPIQHDALPATHTPAPHAAPSGPPSPTHAEARLPSPHLVARRATAAPRAARSTVPPPQAGRLASSRR